MKLFKFFLIVAILTFGISYTSLAADLDFGSGSNTMAITYLKDGKGNVIGVDVVGTGNYEYGSMDELKVKCETKPNGSITEFQIKSALPNDTIIKTSSSPGCTWYFFGGMWYRLCD